MAAAIVNRVSESSSLFLRLCLPILLVFVFIYFSALKSFPYAFLKKVRNSITVKKLNILGTDRVCDY